MEKFFIHKKFNRIVIALLLGAFAGSVKAANTQATENFFEAVNQKDFVSADQAIADGADINGVDKLGRTPLHCATEISNNIETIKYLVGKGVDVDKIHNKTRCPALYEALKRGDFEAIECLVGAKANIKLPYINTWNFLHDAATENWSASVVKYLIEHDLNIDQVNVAYQSSLHIAAREGNYGIVKCLVEAGASISLKDENNKTPRDLAVENNHSLIVDYLDSFYVPFYKMRAFVRRYKVLISGISAVAILAAGARGWYARRNRLPFIPSFLGKRGLSSVSKVPSTHGVITPNLFSHV
ncbi:TPA: hypothetical protein DDZ86_01195 [Candidatus Dependentiae bacterium]|nr:MAG: hypothetical protein UW09_C0004G0120 [candidate division TM6 bacterium GW2011_GWF2_43_87]HBL98242.1 hypothetical protein [Candidatus Dependentiae bacterium]